MRFVPACSVSRFAPMIATDTKEYKRVYPQKHFGGLQNIDQAFMSFRSGARQDFTVWGFTGVAHQRTSSSDRANASE